MLIQNCRSKTFLHATLTPNSHKVFQQLGKEGTLPTLFYDASIALKLTSDKVKTKNKVTRKPKQEGTKKEMKTKTRQTSSPHGH